MHVEHGAGREAFEQALGALLRVADGLDDEQLLAASRCRGWTVGDVLVHVHLGVQEMLLGVVSPTALPPDADAASYWRAEVPSTDPGADAVAAVRFVRLLAAAYRRPTGLVRHLRTTADGLGRAVSALRPGAVLFQGHVLTTGDFLATWAVELAVHHLDLGAELDLPAPPPAALRMARRTVESLAGGPLPAGWDDGEVALLGTGRRRPDEGQLRDGGPAAGRLPVLG